MEVKIMDIDVLYKDYYSEINRDLHLIKESFKAWLEEGGYTFLYKELKDNDFSKPTIIIPTNNIRWIKPK